MSIASRILLGFGLVIGLIAVLGFFQYRGISETARGFERFRTHSEMQGRVHTLDRQVLELQRNVLIFTATGHEAVLSRVEASDAGIRETLDALAARVTNAEQRALYERLVSFRDTYMEAFGRLAEDRFRRDALLARARELATEIGHRLEGLSDSSPRVLAARAAFSRADRELMSYVDRPDSVAARTAKQNLRAAEGDLEGIADAALHAALQEYDRTSLQMVQAIRGYLFLANVVLAGQAAELDYNTGEFRAGSRAQEQALLQAVAQSAQRSRTVAVTGALGALVLGMLVAVSIGRSIAGPIERITETFVDLAEGRAVEQIPGIGRVDEIGDMASAAQVFKERNQQTEELLEVAKGREARLETQRMELERANEELEQFAYVASHDLQEPLRMVGNYVQLLGEEFDGKLGDEADEYIRFASQGAHRMQVLINELLDLSRVGRGEQAPTEVDTAGVLASVERDLSARLEAIAGRVRSGALPTLRGYPGQLHRVFQNLMSNAIKYRRPDVPFELAIDAERTDAGWIFSFRDNGIGIEPRHYDRIFKIFQRLHSRSEYEGSGMGLAIVRKIAEQHRGRVWLESTPGEGTTFFFEVGEL